MSADPLGLNTYTLVPDINAIRQSSNLYAYCMNNSIMYQDPSGEIVIAVIAIPFAVKAIAAVAVAVTAAAATYVAVDYANHQASIAPSTKAAVSGSGATSPGSPPDPGKDQNNLKKISSNSEANKVAQKHGYKNSEALKDDFSMGNGSKFNIHRDTKTGELILKSIQGNTQIPTGLFK